MHFKKIKTTIFKIKLPFFLFTIHTIIYLQTNLIGNIHINLGLVKTFYSIGSLEDSSSVSDSPDDRYIPLRFFGLLPRQVVHNP